METRLFQVLLSASVLEKVLEIFDSCSAIAVWQTEATSGDEDKTIVHALVPADSADGAMTELEKLNETSETLRIVLSSVQATLPRPPEPEDRKADEEPSEETTPRFLGSLSVTTEELVTEVSGSSRLRPLYIVTVGISAVVAAAGLVQNNIAAIIGAMVIAPLLGPNVALALATTLGDLKMASRAVIASLAGVAVAVGIGTATGLLVTVDPGLSEISVRTDVGLVNVLVALASGAAAALAFTTGVSTTLVGVMVAVALLPPAVTLGLMIGSSKWELAIGTALLLLVNIAAVNLSAVVVFLIQGVRPATYWEVEKARKATIIAIASWAAAIILLSVGIWFAQTR